MKSSHRITVYEHQALYVGRGEPSLTQKQLEALQSFHGEGLPYYSLIHNGVKFCEYVGVLQIGNTVIEILPKADKATGNSSTEATKWRDLLIGMLRAVGGFKIESPSHSSLRIRHNSILDLYVALFLTEAETLLHQGLTKQYRQTEGNSTSLKGSLQFGKHLQQNLTHQERFYVRHNIYDKIHSLNQVLHKTLRLLNRINTNADLHSRIGALLLNFPEMPDVAVSDAFFERITYTRKTESYRTAIEIARLLLLNYHPDVRKGQNYVLALLFNMNLLWEQFVLASLKKHKPEDITLDSQVKRDFWKPERGNKSQLRPDIVINADKMYCLVLDTKWKNRNGYSPQSDDLQQMYAYLSYYNADRAILIYPGNTNEMQEGTFYDTQGKLSDKTCSLISIPINPDISEWQKSIARQCLFII
ncbi:restriction endonuclease [Cytophagaceae bacterium DM2B3-1]|uniref:Restriction endonuclease n=1 Tax=Xanthocytophaga flava TaxID=3048013 RepID=A0ABT7CIY2_9BACT|nr:restriction endonuclease [Xanthocytophaga flavus]MDJ1493681.1 restriction endonuclease [Xanthocytophaga flavus]